MSWMDFEDIILSEIIPCPKHTYDPIHWRYLEQSYSQRQKVEGWWPGAGVDGETRELLLNEDSALILQEEEGSGNGWWSGLHHRANVLNATERCAGRTDTMIGFMLCVFHHKEK